MVEPFTSLDELTFGCLSFVTQQLNGQQDSRVSTQTVFVLVLHLAFVRRLAQLEILGDAWECTNNNEHFIRNDI